MRPIGFLLFMMAIFANLTACQHTERKHAGKRLLHRAWTDELNVASSSIELRYRTEALSPQGVHYTEPGPLWPITRSWKPRRFYGPWFAGSHFDAIQLLLGRVGGSLSTWYYTIYFHDITGDDLQIYSQYIPGISTSMAAPRDYNKVPGLYPMGSSAGNATFTDISLSLNEIHLSSLYGGSVELVFRSRENVEVEIRKGDTLWDLRSLEARIYATPKKEQMNPLAPQQYDGAFHALYVELEGFDVTEYSLSGTNIIREASVNVQQLTQALEEIATAIEADHIFRLKANQFVHAWLHVEHQTLIDRTASPPEKVVAIEISDDFLDMDTEQRQPFFTWYVQIAQLAAPHLHHFKVSIDHDYSGSSPINIWKSVETLHPNETSRWIRAGHFPLADCEPLDEVNVEISVRDFHPPERYPALRQVWNDMGLLSPGSRGSTVAEATLAVDCADLSAFQASITPPVPGAVSPNVVLFDQQDADITLLDSDWDSHGSYTLKVKLYLSYR